MRRIYDALLTVLAGIAGVVVAAVWFFAPVILWWCIYWLLGWKW